MRIATPAEKLTDLRVGSTLRVNSFGHDYIARVAELKGNRARCIWRNKSGNLFDNWITIPGRTEKDLNPTAAATRKLRVQATRLEKHAKGWMADAVARHIERIAVLESYRGATPTSEDTKYGTTMYHLGEDSVWGGYTPEGVQRYGQVSPERMLLPFDQALERTIAHERSELAKLNAEIRAALQRVEDLRAQADEIEKGA